MKKEPLCYKLWAKILAYFLLTLFVGTLALSILGAAVCWEVRAYTTEPYDLTMDQFRQQAVSYGDNMIQWLRDGEPRLAENLSARSNAAWRITDSDGKELFQDSRFEDLANTAYAFSLVYRWQEDKVPLGPPDEFAPGEEAAETEYSIVGYPVYRKDYDAKAALADGEYLAEVRIDPAFPLRDVYYWTFFGLGTLWGQRYAVYAYAVTSLILAVVCFVFLMRGAGHRAGCTEPVPGPFYKVPFDLVTLGWITLLGILLIPAMEVGHFQDAPAFLLLAAAGLLAVPLCAMWCASLAMRIKVGGLWRQTVLYRLWAFCMRFLRGCLHLLRRFFRGLAALCRSLPLVWKTALGLGVICVLEFFGIALFHADTDMLLICWFLEKLVLVPVVMVLALMLRRLQTGGRALAAGDLGYQTDTRHMLWDFKEHGENLNAIALGMKRAVESQLKSERLKTELITNVSHDIKTPLTSIINYVDLLKTAEDETQRAEYLEVLDRQSQRLKKLTEDLVEVSKASSGSMEMHPSRHSVSELLHQALGEYGDRLEKAGLAPVLTLPEQELFAVLDGTLTWRVLDNLFSNACKYGQPGTRFYLDAAEEPVGIRLSFKNISREPLNLSAEELMERFVRGDRSRHSEGSGLGLNIAKSLTELQGGVFTLSVDGDLFKVEITLPKA